MNLLLAAVGGALAAISYFTSWWALILVAFVPLLLALSSLPPAARRGSFFVGVVFGLVFFGSAFFWVWSVLPFDWVEFGNGTLGYALVFLQWVFLLGVSAVFVGCIVVILVSIPHERRFIWLLVAPALWVIIEFIRPIMLWALHYADVSLFGPHFTYATIGYILADNSFLLQSARVGGVYLLSFIIIFVNSAIWAFVVYPRVSTRSFSVPISVSVFLVIVMAYATWNANEADTKEKQIHVAVLNAQFSSKEANDEALRRLQHEMFREDLEYIASRDRIPDLIILPEGSNYASLWESSYDDTPFPLPLIEGNTSLIDSGNLVNRQSGEKTPSAAVIVKGEVTGVRDKQFLVPYGEYLPQAQISILNFLGAREPTRRFEISRSYRRGERNTSLSAPHGVVGVFMCSEIASGPLLRDSVQLNMQIIVNIFSHAILHNSLIMEHETQRMASVRAVETDRYIVAAANEARSFVVSNRGEIIAKTEHNVPDIIFTDVEIRDTKTPYMRFGDWIVFVSMAIVAMILWPRKRGLSDDEEKFM